MGRDVEYPLSAEYSKNLDELHNRVNGLLDCVNVIWTTIEKRNTPLKFVVSSGYRPGHYNKIKNAATFSNHLYCKALDIIDVNGDIDRIVQADYEQYGEQSLLKVFRLWQEHPQHTKSYIHLDTGIRNQKEYGIFQL